MDAKSKVQADCPVTSQQAVHARLKTLKKLLKILNKAADAATPELLSLLSDGTPREQRDAYLDYVGPEFNFYTSNKIARLSKLLNATGSETARGSVQWRHIEAQVEETRQREATLRARKTRPNQRLR